MDERLFLSFKLTESSYGEIPPKADPSLSSQACTAFSSSVELSAGRKKTWMAESALSQHVHSFSAGFHLLLTHRQTNSEMELNHAMSTRQTRPSPTLGPPQAPLTSCPSGWDRDRPRSMWASVFHPEKSLDERRCSESTDGKV